MTWGSEPIAWGSEPIAWGSEPMAWGSEVNLAKNPYEVRHFGFSPLILVLAGAFF